MKHFNYLLAVIVLFTVTSCCKKLSDDVEPRKFATGPTTTPIIDTDAFIHSIRFSVPKQYVNVSVSGNELTMIYNEEVNLFIPKEGYDLTYAIHLTEDFANSALSKFSFTTVDAEGDITKDWVDDNLNDVTAKTVSDTTIAGIAMVKLKIQRPFTFTATYDDNAAAGYAENDILMLKTDKIDFSSYVYFTQTYPATSTSAPVTYLKAD